MAKKVKDPTEAIRLRASRYPGVDEGTACTQASFKTGKKSFLFAGMQGGRYKLMFKLDKSIPEAVKWAKKEPDNYGVGSVGWVTARFSADKPMPKKLWEKWLDESYELAASSNTKKKPATKTTKKAAKVAKKVDPKKATKKATTTKLASKRKAAKRKTTRKQ